MTEDDTTVATFGLKNLGASVTARVRNQPRVEHGVVGFTAVAAVLRGDLLLWVALAALGAAPVEYSGIVGSIATP